MTTAFQPTMLGTVVRWEDHPEEGMITDETAEEIFIESARFTGWMSKADYWEMLGTEE